jgi:predicted phosphodiesterase
VTVNGGSVSRLYFAAVGDSRPPNENDTTDYPTAIISQIYQDMAEKDPEFVVATGDYMFASTSSSTAATQMGLYMQARAAYPGVLFAAMGNHECDGYTADNCTSLTQSNNIKAFMSSLMQPLGQTLPYYRFDINDSAGHWTAKFVVLAMNYWNSTQESWLRTQLAQSTTYTFIIRHEPESATTAPGVTPSDSVISQYPYTAKIVGHTHEFSHPSQREVIVGNGGAPLQSSNDDYGYAIIEQTASGDIQVSSMDYSSNTAVSTFTIPK